jgi:hypothetical protein
VVAEQRDRRVLVAVAQELEEQGVLLDELLLIVRRPHRERVEAGNATTQVTQEITERPVA